MEVHPKSKSDQIYSVITSLSKVVKDATSINKNEQYYII